MAEKDPKTKELKEELFLEPNRVSDKLSEEEKHQAFEYAKGYIQFLNKARTERLATAIFMGHATAQGFSDLEVKASRLRVFRTSRGKNLALAVMGKRPLTEGIRVIISHTDAPRLDLKSNPLYEDTDMAFLKSHYYGGIKKYQWVARSLTLVGSVILSDGQSIELEIGLDPDEPVVTIPDLLPHLGRKQMEKKASDFIPAENLNPLVGGLPYEDQDTDDQVKTRGHEALVR